MDWIGDLTATIELMQKCRDFVGGHGLLRYSWIGMIVSGIVFLAVRISIVSDMLSSMKETIIALTTFALILSVSLVVGVTTVDLVVLAFHPFCRKHEAKKKQLEEDNAIKKQLVNLSEAERQVLKYALNQNGNVWLPPDNINVLSLCIQGILIPMTGVSVHRGDIYKGGQCFAYRVSDRLKEYVCENKILDTHIWQSTTEAGEMAIYQ